MSQNSEMGIVSSNKETEVVFFMGGRGGGRFLLRGRAGCVCVCVWGGGGGGGGGSSVGWNRVFVEKCFFFFLTFTNTLPSDFIFCST